jgi:DNA-binding MarR family transcriptional regulator
MFKVQADNRVYYVTKEELNQFHPVVLENATVTEWPAKITVFENNVLMAIATSDYNALNGAIPHNPEDSATWLFVDELAEDAGLTMAQVKGVLSSLVKKGLVDIQEDWGDETLIMLTAAAIDYIN